MSFFSGGRKPAETELRYYGGLRRSKNVLLVPGKNRRCPHNPGPLLLPIALKLDRRLLDQGQNQPAASHHGVI